MKSKIKGLQELKKLGLSPIGKFFYYSLFACFDKKLKVKMRILHPFFLILLIIAPFIALFSDDSIQEIYKDLWENSKII